MAVRDDSSRRILRGSDPEQAVKTRRKTVTVAILASFEEAIEPLLPPGHGQAIENFKGAVRKKINALAYEGIRAARAAPGETVTELAVDIAESLTIDEED